MVSAVLDSSAVLAVLMPNRRHMVIAALDDALLSTVNYADVITKIVERGGTTSKRKLPCS